MSLRVGELGATSGKETLSMILISMLLSLMSVLIFVGILRINGFNISLSELVRFGFLDLFTESKNFVKVLYWTTPLIMTGLAVAIAFQAGLFNIGGQGQMILGAAATGIFAASIAPSLGWAIFQNSLVMIPLCMIIGFSFGFLWGFIPGWLKAKTGAHEVIVTIMMNFIAISTVAYLVGSRTYSPFVDQSSPDAYGQTEIIMESAKIPLVFPKISNFFNYSFFFVIIIAVVLYIFVYKTNGGFKLRAVGYNPSAAQAAGVNTSRVIMMSMGLSGGVAGLGGAFLTMGTFPYRYISGSEGTLGFDGIAVALIGQNNPVLVIFAALIFGALLQSKGNLDTNTDIPPDLIFVFQGLIILFAAAPLIARRLYNFNFERQNFINDIRNLGRSLSRTLSQIGNWISRRITGVKHFVANFNENISKLNPFNKSQEDTTESVVNEITDEEDIPQPMSIFTTLWNNTAFRTFVKVYLFFEGLIILLWVINGLFGFWFKPLSFHGYFWDVIMDTNTFKSMLIASIPIMLTAMGAAFNERVGVINIGLEGIMVWGAWTTVFVTIRTGDHWMGILAGTLVGALIGFVHAFFSITLRAEQIVTGVAINLLALGITEVLSNLFYGQNFELIERWDRVNIYEIPFLGRILETLKFENYYDVPGIGYLLQQIPDLIAALNLHHPLTYVSLFLIIVCHYILFKTKYGLRMRVIGEHPQAAATAGINVRFYQYVAVIFSGAMAGLGGATLVMNISAYKEGVVGGRGFIALAAMIFGKWTIIGSALASMFFGYFLVLQIRLNIGIPNFEVPNPFLQMIPFIASILALAGFIGRANPPKHIGKPYDPTEE